jgi:energy-coupling factor transporter ATP-binding protein EcfA2
MMINFPILDRLDISNYGLYPGARKAEPGLHVRFKPGLTLVIGSNGLGKTTLVSIIYRLLTGPFDIPGLATRGDLGTMRLVATQLSRADRSIFSPRVVDGAQTSTARLSFILADKTIVVERRLSDLTLTDFSVNGKPVENAVEAEYQSRILSLVGVWSFGDWILLLWTGPLF